MTDKKKTSSKEENKPFRIKTIEFDAGSDFAASIIKALRSVDDSSKFISADEFKRKYQHLAIKNSR